MSGRRAAATVTSAALLAFAVVVPVTALAQDACAVSATLVNSCRPWLGANAGGYPGISSSIQTQIEAHEARVGRQVDVAHTYHQPGQNSLNSTDLAFLNRPSTLLLTNWKPATKWADADGSSAGVNATIDQMALSIKAVAPKRIILDVFHEPQNDVSGGAEGCPADFDYVGGAGTPADYRAMWRNVRTRFDALGVDNVVWAVNYMSSDTFDCMVRDLWPGNDLVDWVLFDVYGSPNQTFDAGVGRFYDQLSAWTDAEHAFTSKPWGLGEWNIRNNYTQAQATAVYDDARSAAASDRYPRLKLWAVFDNANGSNTRVGYDAAGQPDPVKQAHYNSFAQDPVFSGSWVLDTLPPSVSLDSPQEDDVLTGRVTVSGQADDDGTISSVRLEVDGADVAGATVSADGQVSVDLDSSTLSNGAHTLALRATDSEGRVSTSDPVHVTVDNADSTPPDAPSPVTADVVAGEVRLTWGVAQDDVGVTGYLVRRDGSTVADLGPVTTWTDTTASYGSTYAYTVVAKDAAGNLSDPSEAAVVGMPAGPDLTPPSPPGSVTAAPLSPTRVSLAWSAATDDVAVASYQVSRDGAVVAAEVTGTSFVDDSVSEATSYAYTVRARDTSGNLGPASDTVDVTTPDATPPSKVSGLTTTAVGAASVALAWTPATDNVTVAGYRVYRDGTLVGTPTSASFSDSSVDDGTTYAYQVAAVDPSGNVGQQSAVLQVTTVDVTSPSRPAAPTATSITGSSVGLSWAPASDNVAVVGYHVWRDGSLVATLGAVTSWVSSGLASATTYGFAVDAVDAAGNTSQVSPVLAVTTDDDLAPQAPSGLTATAMSETTVSITWAAAVDNVGVTGYRVYRNNSLVATLGPSTTFLDAGLAAGTTYTYGLEAFDAAGNVSVRSAGVSATTPGAAPDNTPPTRPARPTLTAGTGSVTVHWTAATDNVAVTGYRVYRGSLLVATVAGSVYSYTDTGLKRGKTYTYKVAALDAAGNVSAKSLGASARAR